MTKTTKTYSKGQLFLRELTSRLSELYVLAVTGVYDDGEAEVNLICLKDGDRWTHPVTVQDCMSITTEEMTTLYRGGEFRPVQGVKIEIEIETVNTVKKVVQL